MSEQPLVYGYNDIKQQVDHYVDIISHPEIYSKVGLHAPHGILFTGTPGNGKTTFARYLLNQCAIPHYIYEDSGDYHNECKALHDLFDEARANAPSLVFIDELDTLVEDNHPFLAALLSELDGIEGHQGVFVIGCAIDEESLPCALTRPGRFDRLIALRSPDEATRREILEGELAKSNLKCDFSLNYLIYALNGHNTAEVVNCVQAMIFEATMKGEISLNEDDVERGLQVVEGESQPPFQFSEESLRSIAIHEAGHVLYALGHPEKFHLLKAAIGVNQKTRGYVRVFDLKRGQNESLEGYLIGAAEMLAGLCAQEVLLGRRYDGGSDDLVRARSYLGAAVNDQGLLGPEVPAGFFSTQLDKKMLSEESTMVYEEAVNKLLNEAHDLAYGVCYHNRKELQEIADVLLSKKVLYEKELCALPTPDIRAPLEVDDPLPDPGQPA
jgi:cell division protease FtsH